MRLVPARPRVVVAIATALAIVGVVVTITNRSDERTTDLSAGATTTTTTTAVDELAGDAADTTTTSVGTTTTVAPPVSTTARPVAPTSAATPALANGFGQAGWIAYGLSDATHVVSPDGTGDYEFVRPNSEPHWSHDHNLIVMAGHAGRPDTYVAGADRNLRKVDLPAGASWPTFTADNAHVLAMSYRYTDHASWTIRIAPVDGGPDRVLVERTCELNWPVASPDGTTIAFLGSSPTCTNNGSEPAQIYLMKPDGSDIRVAQGSPEGAFGLDWTPDSKSLVYGASGDVWLLDVRTGARTQITKTPEVESQPHVSPDGTMIAFRVETGAMPALDVTKLDGSARRRVVTAPIYTIAW
ncbi:MAG TPA: hypothetical protein VMZ22_11380 [Acidimicrobiales bacterium]|nr:hypothetical protein [Acidimicrobiales bacterium]